MSVRYWYRKPPPLDSYMYEQLIGCLGLVLPLHIMMLYRVQVHAGRGSTSAEDHWERLVLSMIAWLLWLVYWGSTNGQVEWLMLFRAAAAARANEMDTQGIPYSRVQTHLGYVIDRYECPAASKLRSLESLERRVLEAFQMGSPSVDRFGEGGWSVRCEDEETGGKWRLLATTRRVGRSTGRVRPEVTPPSTPLGNKHGDVAPTAPAAPLPAPAAHKPQILEALNHSLPPPGATASVSCKQIRTSH